MMRGTLGIHRSPPLCADDPDEVKNDQDVDGQSDRLERRCAANQLVQLERHEQ